MLTNTSSRIVASLSNAARKSNAVRSMSSTANVWVDKNTRVICQGFTGKQVSSYSLFRSLRVLVLVVGQSIRLFVSKQTMTSWRKNSQVNHTISLNKKLIVCFTTQPKRNQPLLILIFHSITSHHITTLSK
jgi:hypothetical protein